MSVVVLQTFVANDRERRLCIDGAARRAAKDWAIVEIVLSVAISGK